MEYLLAKSLQTTMEMMGITEEKLAVLLIFLIVLLVLMFVFIFVGITAFALGGTFGAVVNSLFPAIGGGSLGKKSDSDTQKLSLDTIEQNVEKALAIIKGS